MLTGRGPTARGPGVGPRLHGFCPFGAGLAALLSGGSRPSSGRGIVVASLEGTKVRPGLAAVAPRGRAHLSRRGWPPGPTSRPAPPSGHPCCAGPPRGRPSAPSDRSPALHDRALCVHEELRGGCRVQLTPALREVHPNRTREPWASTKGQATPAPQVPAPHLPCRLGLCTGVHGPPQPRRAQPASPEAGCPSRAVQCGRR